MTTDSNPLEQIAKDMKDKHERYQSDVFNTEPFQNGLKYLEKISSDFLIAQSYVRLMGTRFAASDEYLLFRFAPHMAEGVLAILQNAREGLQNAARRELRFVLEASVKLSARDNHSSAADFDARLAGLDDRTKRFEDYVSELEYFGDFTNPKDANDEILSLYSRLSTYVHVSTAAFKDTISKDAKGETAGRESVSTLNKFNALALKVYDLALVRIFYGLGTSLAGDVFVNCLDEMTKWSFHRAKFVPRMSQCFDYKAERKARPRVT